jgi:hypothetical protein
LVNIDCECVSRHSRARPDATNAGLCAILAALTLGLALHGAPWLLVILKGTFALKR